MTMRIASAELIAGLPAFEARAWVRQAIRWERFTVTGAAALLDQSPRRVARVMKALAAAGFLEPSAPGARVMWGGGTGHVWEVSQLGYRLANATAARPIQRATAVRLLEEIMSRAEMLRDFAQHEYAIGVRRLIVFGSFLGDAPTLNDLDVSVSWAPRFDDREAQHAYKLERIRLARRDGRTFSNISQEYDWPRVEAARFLRGGSHAVSLHDHDAEPEFVARVPHRVLM